MALRPWDRSHCSVRPLCVPRSTPTRNGKQLKAAVATRLLQGGAASVVAMAYSVYAVAAAEFMAAFYGVQPR